MNREQFASLDLIGTCDVPQSKPLSTLGESRLGSILVFKLCSVSSSDYNKMDVHSNKHETLQYTKLMLSGHTKCQG